MSEPKTLIGDTAAEQAEVVLRRLIMIAKQELPNGYNIRIELDTPRNAQKTLSGVTIIRHNFPSETTELNTVGQSAAQT